MTSENKKLDEICSEVVRVFSSIKDGECDEIYESRETRMLGPGFVACEINKAIQEVGMTTMIDGEVTDKQLVFAVSGLINVCETFNVRSLRSPIAKLIQFTEKKYNTTIEELAAKYQDVCDNNGNEDEIE